MRTNKAYIHAFNCLNCIGPQGLLKLSHFFKNNFSEAWGAPERVLRETGISDETVSAIREKRTTVDPKKEYEKLLTSFGEPRSPDDENYPRLLREIPYPPFLLYIRGNLTGGMALAVVGTRRPTAYGKEVVRHISGGLARAGCTIVSGMALGIDGAAHEAALDESAPTIAVLGSGADDASLYPRAHHHLAQKIIAGGGAVVSEFPPGTPALKHHFPQRNRIVAGLSRGTVVIEAREKSGALITARYALEYNRDVFAVPGPIFSATSAGPNALIREGAAIATSAADILSSYGIEAKAREKGMAENELESKILTLLENSLGYDELLEEAGISAPILNSALAMLELKNCVKNIGNRTYIRI